MTENRRKVKVLIVDDHRLFRRTVNQVLSPYEEIEIVGTAPDGRIALDKIEQLSPDLVTLDVEMPDIDGIQVLQALKDRGSPVKAIMLSSLTSAGAKTTIDALRLGAVDFVLKPAAADFEASKKLLHDDLVPKVLAHLHTEPVPPPPKPVPRRSHRPCRPQAVGLGISTGGPQALTRIMPRLPADLPVPVLLVQHMPAGGFTKSLAEQLDPICNLKVKEAFDGETPRPGRVYIAPGGQQMKVVKSGPRIVLRVTDDPPESYCKPSVDYLLRSMVEVWGGDILAVIMTGMGTDGTEACKLVREQGGAVFTQDQETSLVYGMPRGPAENGCTDKILPLDEIPQAIAEAARVGALQ